MARDVHAALSDARALFERAESITGLPITRLCFEGPPDELRNTDLVQPCLLTACAALMLPLQQAGIRPSYVAGHSLGEYTALYASGALTFDAAIRLVRRRGELMAKMQLGTMAAILGLDGARVSELCDAAGDRGTVVVANFNTPGQVVVSGEPHAVEEVSRLAQRAGALKIVPLAVSGAFHSPLMEPASADLRETIERSAFSKPRSPIVTNVDARVTVDPQALREKLVRQLFNPVRWSQSINTLQSLGVTTFWEIGPGKVLTGLLRQIDKRATGVVVNTFDDAKLALRGT